MRGATPRDERYEAFDLLTDFRKQGVVFRLADGDEVRYRPASRLSGDARALIRRYKDEIREILEDESDEAEHDAYIEAQMVNAPVFDPYARPEDGYDDACEQAEQAELSMDQYLALSGWIDDNLWESTERTERWRHSSYQLKHWFELSPEGFYITSTQFQAAMQLAGFASYRYPVRPFRGEDPDDRFYYVMPNLKRAIEILNGAGMQYDWAIRTVMEAHPDPADPADLRLPPPLPPADDRVWAAFRQCEESAEGDVLERDWFDAALALGVDTADCARRMRQLVASRLIQEIGQGSGRYRLAPRPSYAGGLA